MAVGFSALYLSCRAVDVVTFAVNRPTSTVLECRTRTARTTPESAGKGEKGFQTKQRGEWLPKSTLV